MTTTPADYVMRDDDRENPLLWVTAISRTPIHTDTSDDRLTRVGIDMTKPSRLVRSWGHNDDGVHWLLTRGGTPVHTDRAYLRYTHQIVLRNDGTRIRGHPRFDPVRQDQWPPVLAPGAFYCLDTHSPHQGTKDARLPQVPARVKLVVAVDRPEPLDRQEAFLLLVPYLSRQITDDVMTTRPPRWREG